MIPRLVLFVIAGATVSAVRSAPADTSTSVIASAVDISKREPPLSAGINIEFVIHSPESLRATKFILVLKTLDRAQVRTSYPIGSLEKVALPAGTVDALTNQRASFDRYERQIDDGVRPDMISEASLRPSVELAQLKAAPTAIPVTE